MRRMIPNDAFSIEDGNVLFGKNIEVDGKVRLNGAEDLTDKDGTPLIGGGGGGGGIEILDAPPADTSKILFLLFSTTASNDKSGYAMTPYPGSGEATIICGSGGGTYAKNLVGLYYIVGDNAEISIFDVNETCIDASAITAEGKVSVPQAEAPTVTVKYICNK